MLFLTSSHPVNEKKVVVFRKAFLLFFGWLEHSYMFICCRVIVCISEDIQQLVIIPKDGLSLFVLLYIFLIVNNQLHIGWSL